MAWTELGDAAGVSIGKQENLLEHNFCGKMLSRVSSFPPHSNTEGNS